MKRIIFPILLSLFFFFLTSPIFVLAETITVTAPILSDATWSPGNIYVIDSNFSVASGTTLIIEPGVIVKAKITGTLGPGILGKLVAEGTNDAPIYFTSWTDDIGGDTNGDGLSVGTPGEWQGLYFKSGSEGDFDYINLSYAGNGGPYAYDYGHLIGIENDGGTLNIKHSNIYDNYKDLFDWVIGNYRSGYGIYNKSGTLSVSDSVIDNSATGIYIESGNAIISNNIIKNNNGYSAGYGIYALGSEPLTLLNNTFLGNNKTAFINASRDFTHSGNTSEDISNRGLKMGGSISKDVTFSSLDLPYIIQGLTIEKDKTLTLEPGAILKMSDDYSSGNIVIQGGSLIAKGTSNEKIYITSLKDDSVGGDTNGDGENSTPAPKDWTAIYLEEGSKADFDNVVVRYGGFSGGGGYVPGVAATIYHRGAELSVKNSLFEHNQGATLYQDAGTTTIETSEIINGAYGVWSRGGAIQISQSKFENISGYAVYNQSGQNLGSWWQTRPLQIIDARDNWWGSDDGPQDVSTSTPTGSGSRVNENVLYVPFLTEPPGEGSVSECCSSVLFLPGIKGSILKTGSDTLWPPTILSNDLLQLALNDSGESIEDVYVSGILDTFYGTPIYSPFSGFMTELISEQIINEWIPFPYDWRFLPEKILEEGVNTINGNKKLMAEVEALATRSKTGQVTIVTHSMGGLLGKELIKKLEEIGKTNLIDSFVMVGAPQLGTPQAAAALLHGDEEGIASGLIVDRSDFRVIGQNMPSAYNLLPSQKYFTEVADPVITFDQNSSFTELWRNFWGNDIDDYVEFLSFTTGTGVSRDKPEKNQLRIPEILKSNFMADADNFHSVYDNYEFPENIRVVQIAGWGRPTTKSINYKNKHLRQSYETIFTVEGDGTVVYPSAISMGSTEHYFVNLSLYNKNESSDAQHRNLLDVVPIKQILRKIFEENISFEINYVSEIKPILTEIDTQLIISTHSPVILGAYDQLGNFTGIDPGQDVSAEILLIKEEIPGSSFHYSAESQYIFLPKDGIYDFIYKGVGEGPTTVEIQSFVADEATTIAVYSDIPTTQTTSAIFTVDGANPQNTIIKIDDDNDGEIDGIISSDNSDSSLNELLAFLKEKIKTLSIKDNLKKNLIKKIENLEKKIVKKKENNAKILEKFEAKIIKQEIRGKIDTASADEIVEMLDLLEAQAEDVALDADILNELKQKITSLNIKENLKKELLKRIAKLENKKSLIKTLINLTRSVSKKGERGKIEDNDIQEIINIIGQIKNAL